MNQILDQNRSHDPSQNQSQNQSNNWSQNQSQNLSQNLSPSLSPSRNQNPNPGLRNRTHGSRKPMRSRSTPPLRNSPPAVPRRALSPTPARPTSWHAFSSACSPTWSAPSALPTMPSDAGRKGWPCSALP